MVWQGGVTRSFCKEDCIATNVILSLSYCDALERELFEEGLLYDLGIIELSIAKY